MSGSISGGVGASSGNSSGWGPDELILYMAGDSLGPSNIEGSHGQFTVSVDGQQIGGLQTVRAQYSSGGQETFVFRGDFPQGSHKVAVTFANNDGTQGDKTDIGRDGDRNIYVKGVRYNGATVSDTTTPIYESPLFPPEGSSPGNAVFTVNDNTAATGSGGGITSPGPVNVGSGPDRLTLYVSEDPYQGDAQFTVSVDGQQIGGVHTTTAVSWMGQVQAYNFYGNWGSGGHSISVNYVSDRIGATGANGMALDNQDQNLYVNAIDYNGVAGSGTPLQLPTSGARTFYVSGGGQSGASDESDLFSSAAAASGGSSGSSSRSSSSSSGSSSSGSSSSSSSTDTSSSSNTSRSASNTSSGGDNATVSSASLSSGTQSSGGMSFLSSQQTSASTSGSGNRSSGSEQVGSGGWKPSTTDWKTPSGSWGSRWDDSQSWQGRGGWSGNWSRDDGSQWKQSAWSDRYN